MNIPCPNCRKDVNLTAAKDVEQGADTGAWCRFGCECGDDGFICQRDYLRWVEAREKVERRMREK